MRDLQFRATLRRLVDAAILAAFLALTIFAYGALFVGAGRVITSPTPEFSDFYRPGRNPWSGTFAQPAPQMRLAGAVLARRRWR